MKKLCKRCGKNLAVINYCNDCAKAISRAHDSVMERAVAARFYLNNVRPSRELEVAAALSIFHPGMNLERRDEILMEIHREEEQKNWRKR